MGDICEHVDIHQSGVSRHLRILAEAGLVQMRPTDKNVSIRCAKKLLTNLMSGWRDIAATGRHASTLSGSPGEGRGFGATHFALSVATDASIVKQIAERAGWHCVTCNRGPFHVIEVWVENDTMVEVLPPDFAAEYLAWTRPDTVATRMASAPSSGGRHARARSA